MRIFKGLGNCTVYHFGSIVTRRYKNHPTIKTESGSRGGKIFLLKWGFSIQFFKRFILRSDTKYDGELSVIDFKTANKEKIEDWVDNYFLQCTAYAKMYEEIYGKKIEQIVILMASEDGTCHAYIKNKSDYLPKLEKAIKEFYKYYQEQNKDKIKQDK
mgnify:CR=1 FL=1